jgi:hypothetical protein
MLGLPEQARAGCFSMRTSRGASIRTLAFRPDFCSKVIDNPPPTTTPQPTSRSTVMADVADGSRTREFLALRRAHLGDGRFKLQSFQPVNAGELVPDVAGTVAAGNVCQRLRHCRQVWAARP